MLERKRGWALILSVAIMLCTVSVFLSSDVYARRDSGYDRPSYTISSFWERVIDRIADASRGDHILAGSGLQDGGDWHDQPRLLFVFVTGV